MTQQFNSEIYAQKELRTGIQILVYECSQQHHSQQPNGRNNPKGPSVEERVSDVEYDSAIKKAGSPDTGGNMDEP